MSAIKLEICVDSVESAINASQGGADRLELCAALSEGGLTPTPSLLSALKRIIDIPIYCMVRVRGGPMLFSDMEKEVMLQEAKHLVDAGADGLVFGSLTPNGEIDQEFCKHFLKVADGIPCTFHRAFDLVRDPIQQLETAIQLGFQRILTSGTKSSAFSGALVIKELVKRADGRITIMAGAGVKSDNCREIVVSTAVKEIHSSAKMKKVLHYSSEGDKAQMGYGNDDIIYVASVNEVRLIKNNLKFLQ